MATNHDVAQRAVSWLLLNGDVFNDPNNGMPSRAELLEHPINQLNVQYYAKRMSDLPLNKVRKLETKTFGAYAIHDARKQQMFIESGGVFWPVTMVQSYATRIATVVINMYSRNVELWLCTRRYSDTTDRHMSKVRSAFLHATRYGDINPDGTKPYQHAEIFESHAVGAETDRVVAATLKAYTELSNIKTVLHTAIAPKVHEPTRRGAITATSWRLQTLRRHLAYDAPYYDPQANTQPTTQTTHCIDYAATAPTGGKLRLDALQEVDAMLAFTTRLIQTDDNPVPIADLRAQVEAYFALEGHDGRA